MLLVRHGETRANLERRYHGRRDSPLTDRGRAQAHAMGRQIGGLPEAKSAKIVSSPQPRAHRTAEIIREHLSDSAAAVSLDDRLCEVSIGNWEGCSHEEIAALAPGTFEGDGRYEWCFCAPREETGAHRCHAWHCRSRATWTLRGATSFDRAVVADPAG